MLESDSTKPIHGDDAVASIAGFDAAPTQKRSRRWVRRILEGVIVFYVLWCLTLYACQSWLIFPADQTPVPLQRPAKGAEVMTVDVGAGAQVEAWFFAAPGSDELHPAPAVMFFHGNAELIDFQDEIVTGYHRLGWSVFLPEYRGYGRSGGRPSQENIRGDMIRFFDVLRFRPDVDATRIAMHGRSLGGAVAADLARERCPSRLILESTFTSLPDMAEGMFLVPGFICRQPFRTDRVVKSLASSILIFHGKNDHVVPVSHGRRLSALSPRSRLVEFDCGHNDLPPREQESAYWKEIDSFLAGGPQCTCATTKLFGGWCVACRMGYLGGVHLESADLFEALDAHGHKLDGPALECATCRRLINEGGFCDSCKLGFVHGLAYFSRLTYALGKGEQGDPSTLNCDACKHNAERRGWCERCGVGMLGGLSYKIQADYEDAVRYADILAEAVSKPEYCDSCVLAKIADETCHLCKITYRNGRPVARPSAPAIPPPSADDGQTAPSPR